MHNVKCPSYIPVHKLNKLDWVKTGSDIVFWCFWSKNKQCQILVNILNPRPTLYSSFASQVVQIEWKLKEIPYVALTTTPNNAKHSPNDSPILYFPICSEMNLIRQEMSKIQLWL
jgi:hypothetical protein